MYVNRFKEVWFFPALQLTFLMEFRFTSHVEWCIEILYISVVSEPWYRTFDCELLSTSV